MAELILTEEEKAADSYLDWDDASLGRAVKKLAILFNDEYGKDAMWAQMAAHILIGQAERMNSTTTTISLEGVTSSGVCIGDWRVEIQRTKAPK